MCREMKILTGSPSYDNFSIMYSRRFWDNVKSIYEIEAKWRGENAPNISYNALGCIIKKYSYWNENFFISWETFIRISPIEISMRLPSKSWISINKDCHIDGWIWNEMFIEGRKHTTVHYFRRCAESTSIDNISHANIRKKIYILLDENREKWLRSGQEMTYAAKISQYAWNDCARLLREMAMPHFLGMEAAHVNGARYEPIFRNIVVR